MRLENLIRLTQGELLTTPAISAISGIAFDPTKVKPGDLYVCTDRLQSSLEIASKAGAHALIFDKKVTITDSEIAWIEVDNLDMALIRLARFYIANFNIATYKLTNLEFYLLKAIGAPKSFFLIQESLTSLLQNLWKDTLPKAIASNNTLLMQRIAPEAKALPKLKQSLQILPASSLFQTSFILNSHYYQNIPLPPFWIETFGAIIQLLESHTLKYSGLKPLEHFYPLFVDKHLCLHAFGTTRKALIIESDPLLFEQEVDYLKTHYKKSNIFVCAPKSIDLKLDIDLAYENENELLKIDPQNFRYAAVLGDIGTIERLLQGQKSFMQATLF